MECSSLFNKMNELLSGFIIQLAHDSSTNILVNAIQTIFDHQNSQNRQSD